MPLVIVGIATAFFLAGFVVGRLVEYHNAREHLRRQLMQRAAETVPPEILQSWFKEL